MRNSKFAVVVFRRIFPHVCSIDLSSNVELCTLTGKFRPSGGTLTICVRLKLQPNSTQKFPVFPVLRQLYFLISSKRFTAAYLRNVSSSCAKASAVFGYLLDAFIITKDTRKCIVINMTNKKSN